MTNKFKSILIPLGLLFIVYSLFSEDICINEVMSSNQETLNDTYGNSSDWIELYNRSDKSINLENYSITDDSDELRKYVFPKITIEARDYLIIFASGKDENVEGELHAGFKISASGEHILLSNNKDFLIDHIEVPSLDTDVSFGRFPDGSEDFQVFEKPTPNRSNVIDGTLEISHNTGFYTEPFNLELNSPLDYDIYYTLDASEPDSNSIKYQGAIKVDYLYDEPNKYANINSVAIEQVKNQPIYKAPDETVEKATIIRTATFINGIRVSAIHTKTYWVDSTINNRYNLPVISIISDSLNFFGAKKGIYVRGDFGEGFKNEKTGNFDLSGDEWERPVHIEYLTSKGELEFSQDAGIRIHGNYTRKAPQKSLRLYARKEYGKKYFSCKLLPNRNIDKYKRFILRATVGDYHDNYYPMITDVVAHNIVKNLDLEYQEDKAVVVFLNGEYWGIHTIRDRIDGYYYENFCDVDKDDIEELDIFNQESSDYYQYILANNLAEDNAYQEFQTLIDIDNFIDYSCAQIFLASTEWPYSTNYKMWRSRSLKNPWRWVFFDLDIAMVYFYNNSLYNLYYSNTYTCQEKSSLIYRELWKNEFFLKKFLDRYYELLDTEFHPSVTIPFVEEKKNELLQEMPFHIKRWHVPKSLETWEIDVEETLVQFLEKRPNIERNFIKELFGNVKANDGLSHGEFILAPNPNNGQFSIINLSETPIINKISITNLLGQNVFSMTDIKLESSYYIDVSNLPAGSYYITIYYDNQVEQQQILLTK